MQQGGWLRVSSSGVDSDNNTTNNSSIIISSNTTTITSSSSSNINIIIPSSHNTHSISNGIHRILLRVLPKVRLRVRVVRQLRVPDDDPPRW